MDLTQDQLAMLRQMQSKPLTQRAEMIKRLLADPEISDALVSRAYRFHRADIVGQVRSDEGALRDALVRSTDWSAERLLGVLHGVGKSRLTRPLAAPLQRAALRLHGPFLQRRDRVDAAVASEMSQLEQLLGEDLYERYLQRARNRDQFDVQPDAPELREHQAAHQAMALVQSVHDGLGLGVDEKIQPLVAGLMRFGVRTSGSCEGHLDWGAPSPWVDFDPDDVALVQRLIGLGQQDGQWVIQQFGSDGAVLRPVGSSHEPEMLSQRELRGLPQQLDAWQQQAMDLGDRLLGVELEAAQVDPMRPKLDRGPARHLRAPDADIGSWER